MHNKIILAFSKPQVFSTLPDDNEVLLRSEEKISHREPVEFVVSARKLLGWSIGLPFDVGEDWYKLRKVVNQHFLKNSIVWSHSKQQHEVAEEFVDYIGQNLDENNEVPHFQDLLQKWALESTAVFCFGVRLGRNLN
uniref:Uncharacterized protein n=1 Tax=Ciona intestinalis TaxID=7719 RepID=F6Z1W3_CIOIN